MIMKQIIQPTAIAALCLLALPTELNAKVAQYDIDWRGLPIGEVTFTLDQGEQNYRLSYEVRSTGFLSLFFEFESRGYSSGLIRNDQIVATTHSAISSVRGEPRSWSVGFELDGELAHLDVQEDGEREPVPEALQRAPDPLALALTALKDAAPGAQLAGQSFDGRRAVKLNMACNEQGEATQQLVCLVDGELLAGASKRYREDHGDDDPPVRRPIQITLEREIMPDARMIEGFGDGWWPVELEAESRYGIVRAVLNRPPVTE